MLYPDARFEPLNQGSDSELCQEALRRELVVFSADRFNFVQAPTSRPCEPQRWGSVMTSRADSVYFADGLPLDRIMI